MRIFAILFLLPVTSCHYYNGKLPIALPLEDSTKIVQASLPISLSKETGGTSKNESTQLKINTGNTKPGELLAFAKSLIGIQYRYGSSDPANGFDCSGFITYVFNHFNITVPRSSVDFTHCNTEVDWNKAQPGDLILFTGTDSVIHEVGHMGIITAAGNGAIEFIHSSSGKAHGVVITPLNTYYLSRLVKVIRVF